jgi:hypothetical protein
MDVQALNRREKPRLDSLGFDPRLMSAGRLLELAGKTRVRLGSAREVRSLDCDRCGKAVDILTDEAGRPYPTSPMQILTAALRHEVMRHNLSLSGGSSE